MSLARFLAVALTVLTLLVVPVASAAAQEFKPYWVQTHSPTELWSGGEASSKSFGPIRTWSYLQVLEPQKGPRLYVKNPLTDGTAWVDSKMVGPSDAPPESYLKGGPIVTKNIDLPGRTIGSARVREQPEVRDDNLVGNLGHNSGIRVIEEVVGGDNESWYRIADNQFIHADSVRIPRQPRQQRPGRWIDADLQEPAMIAMYEDGKIVDVALTLKGTRDWETPVGTFTILRRVASEIMNSETLGIPRSAAGGYYLTNVLFTQYFTNDGSSFHYNYWSGNFGYRGSHGCLGLNYDDAIFLWHWADVGTVVDIHN